MEPNTQYIVVNLVAGTLTATVVGSFLVPAFQGLVDASARLPRHSEPQTGPKKVPVTITGNVERLFFGLLVAIDLQGVAPSMVAWIGIKMIAHWNSPQASVPEASGPELRARRFSALLTGLVSMGVAAVSGKIARSSVAVGPTFWFSGGVIVIVSVLSLVTLHRVRRFKQRSAA